MEGDLKYGVPGKTKSFEKRPGTETPSSLSLQDDSLGRMMVIGKGFPINNSRTRACAGQLHQRHSDTSINPLHDDTQPNYSLPSEGFKLDIPEQKSASSMSFASAISDLSTSGAVQKKIHDMECELSGKDATISFLMKQLNLDADYKIEFSSVAVETDLILPANEDYQSQFNEPNEKLVKGEKTILETKKEIEENRKQAEENKNLMHEINLVNKQCQSMYKLEQSKQWEPGNEPKDIEKVFEQLIEMEDIIIKKNNLITQLEENLNQMKSDLQQKDILLTEATKNFLDYKNSSATELNELHKKVSALEKCALDQEQIYDNKILEAQKKFEDDISCMTKKLETQYQEDLKAAMERCRSGFKKLSGIPRTKLDRIIKLCEAGKVDDLIIQNDWQEQKILLEKKVNILEDEKKKEINRVVEAYESKISNLKSQIKSLSQQLKERKETLDTFESELKLYREEKLKWQNAEQGSCNVNDLKQMHAAEIELQRENHKLEKDLLQNKVKRLSEEILSHANNEKIQLQELQSAKLMASTFREKYEQLVIELEEKVKLKKESDHSALLNELDLENSLNQFRSLILSLKKAEGIHEHKIQCLRKLDEEEVLIHEREINFFKAKIEEVDRFQTRLLELDSEIKELIKTVGRKYTSTVEDMSSCHYSEVKLKELQLDVLEQQNSSEVQELRKLITSLEEAKATLENEMRSNKVRFEKELQLLKHQIEELSVELLRNEGMLAIKSEIEDTLTSRIQQLEKLIDLKNKNTQRDLESALSKCMTMETLLSAKEEIAREYECSIKDSERIVGRSYEQAGEIEKNCMKLEESCKKLEGATESVFSLQNCENFLILKEKIDHLTVAMAAIFNRSKHLEEEYDHLTKTNSTLTNEKGDLAKKYQELKVERDRIIESFQTVETVMSDVIERSRNFENNLIKTVRENKLIEELCDDIIQKNWNGSVCAGSLLEKVEKIGDQLGKAFGEKDEMLKCMSIEMEKAEGFEMRESALNKERNKLIMQNNILRENIKILTERVDYLLLELGKRPDDLSTDLGIKVLYYDQSSEESSSSTNQIPFRTDLSETLNYVMRYSSERGHQMWHELVDGFETLEEGKNQSQEELEDLRNENVTIQRKLDTDLKQVSDETCANVVEDSFLKEMKLKEMKSEMKRLMDFVKSLKRELEVAKRENEKFTLESRHRIKGNRCLKDELEETWSQKHVEDQLANLVPENGNLHQDQFEEMDKNMSNLISEETPSVVSWHMIHETVENIVEVIQGLKTSFTEISTDSVKRDQPKSKVDFKTQTATLYFELKNKTILCQELISQNLMLEKQLENLQKLMKQSKSSKFHYKPEKEMRGCSSHRGDSQIEHLEPIASELDELKKKHEEELRELNRGHEIEMEKLREMLKEVTETGDSSLLIHEIESKHNQQMEELRRYFEKKCAELEKNFSEEVFSHHSRKMSNDSEITLEELQQDNVSLEKNEDTLQKYSSLLDEDECDNEKKIKYLNYVTEIIKSHAQEVNCIKTKHSKETENLQKRLNQMKEELEEYRKKSERDKELLTKEYEKQMKMIVMEERKTIASSLEKEFESKVKSEIKRLSDLLQAESKAQKEERANIEESCMEKLSVYQTESALKKIETERELERRINRKNEEKFKKLLEEEKLKIAQHYKSLNDAALNRFNEEQENLIKSHAEVIRKLIQEHEERISELKRTHRQDLEKFHCAEETKLTMEFQNKEKKFEKELSSIKSTYEDELHELRKCCQDTLNEQVSLAKADAYNTLQKQLQDYLNGKDENEVPTSKEVIELGERFAGKYRREIEELKQRHLGEVTRIRTEYEEKIRRRYSTGSIPKKSVEKMEMKTDDDKLQILRERDALQEMVSCLRHILSELIRYVGSCEDELNNTIVSEFGKNEETVYKSFLLNSSEISEADSSSLFSKKVHIAPDLSSIISEINDSRSLNTSVQVRMELDRCLKQLKNDASHLLALSNPSKKQDENLYELLLKIEEEKNSLAEKVLLMEEMQKDLKMEVNKTKGKLADLERSKETVSEGYGEEVVNAQRQENLIKLKEKAKVLMGMRCQQPSDILSVLDEICTEGDRLQEEARREKIDLQLQEDFSMSGTMNKQVAAADKQLRATRKFLEEQAAEREIERDDYINEIKRLKEALKTRERDRSFQDRMNQELMAKPAARRKSQRVETLENQLRDANGRLIEVEHNKAEVDSQLKEAVDKIWTLREIIRDLEGQVATLTEGKATLQFRIEELECGNDELEKANKGLMLELESIRTEIREEYAEQMKNLEEELGVLRRTAESLSPESMSQMRVNLREIEFALTKKTKDLEQLHMSSANVSCSSPSEDISISERLDMTGCPTPDEMQNCESQKMCLPMEEIDRINEKLIRHTRAEEVAIKTVRDLKMQLKNNRKAIEEIQIERDVLFERADKYLQENSRLKVRLDEQRCNAGIIQRQLSADLEAQIKRLELDIEKLNELCIQKDKQIRDMNIILEQTTKSLKIREAEVLNKSNEENEMIMNLKTELHSALDEKKKLEETVGKMKETIRETVTMPFLLDSMLEEKNAEIDRLEKEVSRLSKQRAASSLLKTSTDSTGSTKSLKRVKFSEPDSFVQFISPILPEEQSIMRCTSDSYADLKISTHKIRKSNYCVATPESLSSIGALQLSPRGADSPSHWSTSRAPLMSSPKPSERDNDVESLRRELLEKTEKMKQYECELSERHTMDAEIDVIRHQLKTTMDAVQQDKSLYKKEFEKMLENESELQSELETKKMEISEQLLEIDTLKRKLAEVNLQLETAKSEHQKLENDFISKDEEIKKLNNSAESLMMTMETLKRNHLEEVEELQNKLNFEHNRVESVLGELKILEVKKVEIEEEFLSLKEDYNEKLTSQQKTVSNLKAEISELNLKNKELSENNEKLKSQIEATLIEADKLSKNLTDELTMVKAENDKFKSDYLILKNDIDKCLTKMTSMAEAGMQTNVEANDNCCQTDAGSVKKPDMNEEIIDFQANIDKLKMEISAWEEKMDERELGTEEALSYVALIRTFISCILENLDDHFYELQTYRRKVMECSVDDLTDKVQKELLLSAKLDNKLLSNFQTDLRNQSECVEEQSTLVDYGDGDNNQSLERKKQNLVNLTIKLYELETNLQDMEKQNKDFEVQIASLEKAKEEEKKRADGLQVLVKILEESLAKERAMLAEEKNRCDEDAKITEVLKANFELFVERVEELERALTSERQHRMTLENMIKNPTENKDSVPSSELKCQLEIERQKSASLSLSVEKEKKKNHELKIQLEQEKLERITEKDMQRLLNKDLVLLREQKGNLESQLSFARELLQNRQAEITSLKRKINLQEIDIKALSVSSENQHEKEAEISLMAEKMSSLQKELDFYRKQMECLNEKSESISAPLLMKMKILNNCVEQHVQESNEMGEALLHLTQETEQMRSLIKKIEETTEGGALSNSSEETILADIDTERKTWMAEKERLTKEVEKAKCDYEILKKDSMEVFKSNDSLKLEIKKLKKEVEALREEIINAERKQVAIPEDKVLHLFSKYMRTESFRKALTFQKLYLTSVLNGYEGSEEEALMRLWRGGSCRRKELRRKHLKSKKKSLKMFALVIIAIKRMQFMVARWRICRITAFNAIMGQFDPPTANKENEYRRHSSSGLHIGPIDPLRYQTHNFLKRSQANVLRTPPSRDPDSRRPLDARKITEGMERLSHMHNLGQSSRPP